MATTGGGAASICPNTAAATARAPAALRPGRRFAPHYVGVAGRVPRDDQIGSRPEEGASQRGRCRLQVYTCAGRYLDDVEGAAGARGGGERTVRGDVAPANGPATPERGAPSVAESTAARSGTPPARGSAVAAERADLVARAPEQGDRLAGRRVPQAGGRPPARQQATSVGAERRVVGIESRSSRSAPASRGAATVMPEPVAATSNRPARTTSATVPSGLSGSTSPSPGAARRRSPARLRPRRRSAVRPGRAWAPPSRCALRGGAGGPAARRRSVNAGVPEASADSARRGDRRSVAADGRPPDVGPRARAARAASAPRGADRRPPRGRRPRPLGRAVLAVGGQCGSKSGTQYSAGKPVRIAMLAGERAPTSSPSQASAASIRPRGAKARALAQPAATHPTCCAPDLPDPDVAVRVPQREPVPSSLNAAPGENSL